MTIWLIRSPDYSIKNIPDFLNTPAFTISMLMNAQILHESPEPIPIMTITFEGQPAGQSNRQLEHVAAEPQPSIYLWDMEALFLQELDS